MVGIVVDDGVDQSSRFEGKETKMSGKESATDRDERLSGDCENKIARNSTISIVKVKCQGKADMNERRGIISSEVACDCGVNRVKSFGHDDLEITNTLEYASRKCIGGQYSWRSNTVKRLT